MRVEGHIGPLEGTMMVFALLTAKLFVQYPSYLIEAGGPAAWQVGLVMTGTGLLVFLPMAALVRRFPGRGLAEISQEVAGSALGGLLTLLVSAWLFAHLANGIRKFSETFIVSILPETPPSVLAIVVVLCAVYASYRGLEPLGRGTQILFPIIAAGAVLMLCFSLPRVDMSRLYPFWGYGVGMTLLEGLWLSSMVSDAVVLLAVAYAFRQSAYFRTSGLVGILLFGLLATVTVVVLVGIFGAPDAAQQPFPMFNLARLVYFGRFGQRFESLMVMFWFFAAAVRLALLLHGAVVSLAGALRLPYYRPLLFPLAVVAVAVSILPKDFISVLRIDRDWLLPLGLVVLAIPALLLVIAMLRGKGGESRAA